MLATLADYGMSADAGVQHRWDTGSCGGTRASGTRPGSRTPRHHEVRRLLRGRDPARGARVSPRDLTSRTLANLGFASPRSSRPRDGAKARRRAGGAPLPPLPGSHPGLLRPLLLQHEGHTLRRHVRARGGRDPRLRRLAKGEVARVLGAGVLVGLAARCEWGDRPLRLRLVLWLGILVLRSGRAGEPGWPGRREALRSPARGPPPSPRGGRRWSPSGRGRCWTRCATRSARRALRAVLGGHAAPLRRPAPARAGGVALLPPELVCAHAAELYLVAFLLARSASSSCGGGAPRPDARRRLLQTVWLASIPGCSWPASSSTGWPSTTAFATSCSWSPSSPCSPASPWPPSSAPRPGGREAAGLAVLAARASSRSWTWSACTPTRRSTSTDSGPAA